METEDLYHYQRILRNFSFPLPPPQADDHVQQIKELRKALESKDQAAAEEEWTMYQAERQSLEVERAERQRLFDAALDGLAHDEALQKTRQSFKEVLERCYEQKRSALIDKYKKIERQRAGRRKTEEQALEKQIYEGIILKRRQSMTKAQSQKKALPLSTPEAGAPRTPAETPPPLNSPSPNLDRPQSIFDASTNPPDRASFTSLIGPEYSEVSSPPPVGHSDGAIPVIGTSQQVPDVPPSVLPPTTVNLPTPQASHSNALEPISPVDEEDSMVQNNLSQAKLLSKRAREDDVLPSESKRVRTRASQIAQERYSLDANSDAVDQAPPKKVVHNPEGSTTPDTTVPDNAQNLEIQQDSVVQTPSDNSSSNLDTGPSNEEPEQHETDPSSRTITMEEIRGDKSHGEQRYHFIIQEGGSFWIAKCTEHGVHFGENVKQGAAKHLNGRAHGLSRRRDQVLRLLGFRITDCTEKLAKENNKNFKAKLKLGYKPLNLVQRGRHEQVHVEEVSQPKATHHLPEPPNRKQEELTQNMQLSSVPTTQPVAGDLWVGYIEREQVHYGVRILPLAEDLSDPGLLPVSRTPLWKKDAGISGLPSCYVASGTEDIQWAPGYEDGGPRVEEREYPVLVFDGAETYDWISSANLKPFNLVKKDEKVSRWRKARDEYARLRGYKDYLHMQTDLGRTRRNRRLSQYPVPGKMYAARFEEENDNGVFGVMVLPWLPELGEKFPKALRDLMDRNLKVKKNPWIPGCYSMTPESKISGWAKGYEDGGKYVPDRWYPILWFDWGLNLGWVPGSALLGFDFENDHCGREKIHRFKDARLEYAKIFGYKNYADMKTKSGVPETTSRPLSAGIVLGSDSESEDSESETDAEGLAAVTGNTEDQATAQGVEEMDLDVDADDQITGSDVGDDDGMPVNLNVDNHQPASVEKASEPGVTAVTDSDKATITRQTFPDANGATVSAASNLQPTTKDVAAVPTEEATSQLELVQVRSVADPRSQSVDGPRSKGRRASAQHKPTQKQPARATSEPFVSLVVHTKTDKAQDLERMRRAHLKLKKKPPCIGPRPNASWVIVPNTEKLATPRKAGQETSLAARGSPHPSTAAGEATRLTIVPAVSRPETPVRTSGTTTNKPQAIGSHSGRSETTSVINAPAIAKAKSSKPATQPEAYPLRTNLNLALPRRPHVAEAGGCVTTSQPPQTLVQPVVPVINHSKSDGLFSKPASSQAPTLPHKPAARPGAVGSKARTIGVGVRMPIAPMAVMELPAPEAQDDTSASVNQVQKQNRMPTPQIPIASIPGMELPAPEARNDNSASVNEGQEQSQDSSGAFRQSTTSVSLLMQTARDALKVTKSTATHEVGSTAIESPTPDRASLSIDTSVANNRQTNATLAFSATPNLSALRKELDSEPMMLSAYSSAPSEAQLAENQQAFATGSLFVAIDHSYEVIKSVPGSPIHILIRPKEVKRFVMERFDDGTGRATLFMGGGELVQQLHFANMPGANNRKVLPGWRSCSFLWGYVKGFEAGVILQRISPQG
ncbi:hypothetical protein MCOR25_003584 [Pyricularia grisea]|nr:hypothetical protein MCOR25_003584 [Pyricularia grisea]